MGTLGILSRRSRKRTLISIGGGGNAAPLGIVLGTSVFLSTGTGMSGKLLSCCKGVKDPSFKREGVISQDAGVEKGLIVPGGENEPPGFSRVLQVPPSYEWNRDTLVCPGKAILRAKF